jgi:leader peptidase (prepilin peptidase)/N-methyltransferase
MAGLGAGLGWQNLPLMVFLAAMAALAAALAGTLTSGKNALDPARALPFGAALAAATVCVWIALRFPV